MSERGTIPVTLLSHVNKLDKLMCFTPLYFLRKLRQDGQRISNYAKVGHGEDGGMLVFVDRHNVFGALHACQVLDRSANTTGDIERRLHGLAGLPNLVAVRKPTCIDNRTRGPGCTPQGCGQFLDEMEILCFAKTASAADNHTGVLQGGSFARYLDAVQNFDPL